MDDIGLIVMLTLVMLALGAFAGVLAGLLGVGGGVVLVAAFFYAFSALGYAGPDLMQMCLATSLATIIVTSVRSVMAHQKRGAVDWDILRGWGPGIVIGAALGVGIAATLRSEVLQMIFGVLAITVGLYMAFGRSGWRLGAAMPGGAGRVILSPLMGFLSVLMGIGGGSFGVPLMTLFAVSIHRAVATAAGFGVLIGVPSVIGFLFVPVAEAPPLTIGSVNLIAFFLVIAMTLITTPWGAALAHRMDPGPLKRLFGVFLTLVALNMMRQALW